VLLPKQAIIIRVTKLQFLADEHITLANPKNHEVVVCSTNHLFLYYGCLSGLNPYCFLSGNEEYFRKHDTA